MESTNDYNLFDNWDENLANNDNYSDDFLDDTTYTEVNYPVGNGVFIPTEPDTSYVSENPVLAQPTPTSEPFLPESALDPSTGTFYIPPKPAPRQARLDPFVTWVPPTIQLVSNPRIMHVTEAKPFCKQRGFRGYIFAPARILSHVRSDKRRFLDDINVQYFETK